MKKYSVVLLLPDYIDDHPRRAFYTFVEAISPTAAVYQAQKKASQAYAECRDHDDFLPLIVLSGHHRDLSCFIKS